MLGLIITAMLSAFVTGGLARWALPGPDPMPAWLTIVIGFGGTAIGTGIVFAVEGRHTKDSSWAGIASFLSAVGLVVLYRLLIQKRPLWGKDAFLFPQRGVGVEQYRERLKKVGIDPDQPFGVAQPSAVVQQRPAAPAHDHPGEPTENPAHYLRLLDELHDSGVLTSDEYNAARLRLLETLR